LAKRYVLYEAKADVSNEELEEVGLILGRRHVGLKVIPVAGSRRALIVKTTDAVAPELRERSGRLTVGGTLVEAVLTSGSIGKLKRIARAGGTNAVGKIHE
jgi:hypothetical protein